MPSKKPKKPVLIYSLRNPFLLNIMNTHKKYGNDAKLAKIIKSFNVYKISPDAFLKDKRLEFNNSSIDVIMLPSGESGEGYKNIDFLNINSDDIQLIAKELERVTHKGSYVLFVQDFVPRAKPDISIRDVSNHLIEKAVLFLENRGFTGVSREWIDMFPILEELSDSFWIGKDRFHGLHNIILRKTED